MLANTVIRAHMQHAARQLTVSSSYSSLFACLILSSLAFLLEEVRSKRLFFPCGTLVFHLYFFTIRQTITKSCYNPMSLPDNQRWYEASTYREVLDLNRAFIRGELKTTVYHGGPLCDETTPLIPNLLSLHDYGILTHAGQPHQDDGPFFTDYKPPALQWSQWRQRPYLDFLVPRTEVRYTSSLNSCNQGSSLDRHANRNFLSHGLCSYQTDHQALGSPPFYLLSSIFARHSSIIRPLSLSSATTPQMLSTKQPYQIS